MLDARYGHCMTVISGDCLLVTGGLKKESTSAFMREVEIYDVRENEWRSVAPLNEARAYHAALEVREGVVYVFYGKGTGNKHIDSIERYMESTDRWETIQTDIQIQSRIYPGVVSINDGEQVVIFGGSNGKNYFLADLYVLHTKTNRLELLKEENKVKVQTAWYPCYYD